MQIMDDTMTDMLNPHTNEMLIREHPQLGMSVLLCRVLCSDVNMYALSYVNEYFYPLVFCLNDVAVLCFVLCCVTKGLVSDTLTAYRSL